MTLTSDAPQVREGDATPTHPDATPSRTPRDPLAYPTRHDATPTRHDATPTRDQPDMPGRTTVVLSVEHTALIAQWVEDYYPGLTYRPGDIVQEMMEVAAARSEADKRPVERRVDRIKRLAGS